MTVWIQKSSAYITNVSYTAFFMQFSSSLRLMLHMNVSLKFYDICGGFGWLVGWLIVVWTLLWFLSTYLVFCSKTVLKNSLCLLPLGLIFFFRSFSFYYFLFLHLVMMLFKRFFLTFVACISQYLKIKECFLKIRGCQNTQEKNFPWEQNCLCCDLPSIFTQSAEISIIESCLSRADNRTELNLHHLRAL